MIVERTENPVWLSNAYLLADRAGGTGVLIDGNDDLGPLLQRVERDGIEVTHVLVTHPHGDHVAGLAEARRRSATRRSSPTPSAWRSWRPGRQRRAGRAEDVRARRRREARRPAASRSRRSTPPATRPATSPSSSEGADVFTADVLFKGTVGGTMAPGASGFADLKASVMRLMELPPQTRVHPGHREPTTIGEEWECNPFVRVWRGLEETGDEQVTVWDRPATLKLWAPDYDGGNKAWIVFGDDGTEAIVGGSQVMRG